MPWEETTSEIRHRIREPKLFDEDTFRRITIQKEPPIYAIIGKLLDGDDSMVIQALRFPKEKFTLEDAKAWVASHENIKEATDSTDIQIPITKWRDTEVSSSGIFIPLRRGSIFDASSFQVKPLITEQPTVFIILGKISNYPIEVLERYSLFFPFTSGWNLERAQEWCNKNSNFLESQTSSGMELSEACTLPTDVYIDEENRRIKNVAIIRPRSRNGYTYSEDALREAIPLFESSRIYIDHPTTNTVRSYKDLVGKLTNVRECKDSSGFVLRGDLNCLSEQKKLFEIAKGMPEIIGLSANVVGLRESTKAGDVITKIVKVVSVDIVTTPATTNSLFESEVISMDWKTITLAQLQEARPDLVEACTISLKEDNRKLNLELDSYREEESKRKRNVFIDVCLQEANLKRSDCSSIFLQQLQEATSDLVIKQLIQDRATLASKIQKPESREMKPLQEHVNPTNTNRKQELIQAIKG